MKLHQVALTVDDLPASTAFYRDTLGLPLLFEFPNLAFFNMGGVRLMLSGTPSTEKHDAVLYYLVDDLQKEFQTLLERGAKLERIPLMTARMPDHELWIGFVRDPQNRLVGIMSEVRS